MATCRPALITDDTPERLQTHRHALEQIRGQIKEKLAAAWTEALETLPDKLQSFATSQDPGRAAAARDPGHPLHAWTSLHDQGGTAFARTWARLMGHDAGDEK